jgi:hypothetical protein
MSRAERIAKYIRRQYVTEEGAVRSNVEALFAEDLAYHVGGETLNREDVVAAVIAVRESPRDGRQVEPSGFVEDGEAVRWHISATLPGLGPNNSELIQESELRAVFNSDDMIQEVWSDDVDAAQI